MAQVMSPSIIETQMIVPIRFPKAKRKKLSLYFNLKMRVKNRILNGRPAVGMAGIRKRLAFPMGLAQEIIRDLEILSSKVNIFSLAQARGFRLKVLS